MWYVHPLTPLMESPDPEAQGEKTKKERSWEVIRTWVRMQKEKGVSWSHLPIPFLGNSTSKNMDLKLILGILGCPLAPIPSSSSEPSFNFSIKDTPIVSLLPSNIHSLFHAKFFNVWHSFCDCSWVQAGDFLCSLHNTAVLGGDVLLETSAVHEEHVCNR